MSTATESKTTGTAPQPHGKKLPRDVEIKNELRVLEYKHHAALRALADKVSKVRRDELHKSLTEHQKNHAVKNAKVNAAAANRDRAVKDANLAHTVAVRKAQSDLQKAINSTTMVFEAYRDGLEIDVAATNKPIHEAQVAKDTEILQQAEATVRVAAEAYADAIKPLQIELAAIEEAQAAKQKKYDAEKTATTPAAVTP
jgi:hypothetical protein